MEREIAPKSGRLTFLDGLRGIALILMVINHTSRDWLDASLAWPRYYLIYGSVLLPAAIFLFLNGFVLPIGYYRSPQPAGPTAWKFFRRGIGIIAGGYLLNVIVLRHQPVWSGDVLHAIGLSVILLGLLLPLMRFPWTRWVLLAAAVVYYLAFVHSIPALSQWSIAHPDLAKAVFNDFPPWPWLTAAVLGLVIGWTWLDARARGREHEDRYFIVVAIVGVLLLLWYVGWEWLNPTTPGFGFDRDYGLNRHWSPRGATIALVLGGIAVLLAAAYWLMERRGLQAPWLVTLGQASLMLYFVHQIIELTLVNELLGIRMTSWPVYWIANVLFVILLVFLGRAWLWVKDMGGTRRSPQAPLAAAAE